MYVGMGREVVEGPQGMAVSMVALVGPFFGAISMQGHMPVVGSPHSPILYHLK